MARHPNLALERSLSVAFVATCPPRQCGIATFSSDLERALRAADPSVLIQWAAINEATSHPSLRPEVRWRIRQGDPRQLPSRGRAPERVRPWTSSACSTSSGCTATWGDPFEDHLTAFLDVLEKPLVTTLHSVLPDPSPSVRAAVQRIAQQQPTAGRDGRAGQDPAVRGLRRSPSTRCASSRTACRPSSRTAERG